MRYIDSKHTIYALENLGVCVVTGVLRGLRGFNVYNGKKQNMLLFKPLVD